MRRIFNSTAAGRRLHAFLKQETAGGMVMLAFAAIAVIWANAPQAELYQRMVTYPVAEGLPLAKFVKDVLMAIFFLLVGMELKREMLEGALSHKGQKILPLIAALGGIIVPACIYLTLTAGVPELRAGWAIPTATDIAFALCVLMLVGRHVPTPAKVFLLAIAIYDDLAAILIIAFFYSHGVDGTMLLAAAGVSALLLMLGKQRVPSITLYLLLGALLWWVLKHAGIHMTVAGVITGMAIPLRDSHGHSPLNHFLHRLHPWVAFFILPLFALVSAGVSLQGLTASDALSPLPLGIALALAFGKPIGIMAATYASVKLKFAPLPRHVSWRVLLGVGAIAGIGFTMSLFVGMLAFSDVVHHNAVRLGVIAGSLLSAVMGYALLRNAR